MSIQRWPCFGIGAAYPGNSLPTCSSWLASVQQLQFVHLATSTIRFHFFMRFISISSPRSGRHGVTFFFLFFASRNRGLDRIPLFDLDEATARAHRVALGD